MYDILFGWNGLHDKCFWNFPRGGALKNNFASHRSFITVAIHVCLWISMNYVRELFIKVYARLYSFIKICITIQFNRLQTCLEPIINYVLHLNKVMIEKVHTGRGHQIININNLHMEYMQIRTVIDEITKRDWTRS